jgi:3-hydroxyacyl-[acyl-carrier-protein] dehydratase
MLSNIEVQNIIPHRYPFLLVDKVLELEPGKRAVAIKNVTINEPFFQGHFPGYPIMPGVLIVEALAQTAGIAAASLEENKGRLGVFTGIDSMKFRKQVVPGDVLRLEAEILNLKMGMAKVKVLATVDGKTAAEGEIKFAMINAEK